MLADRCFAAAHKAARIAIVAALKERKMKTGDGRWAVITLEDTFGQAEVMCFSRVYAAAESVLKAGAPVLIKGRTLIDDVDDDGKQLVPKMRAESVELLSEAQIRRTRWLDVTVDVAPRVDGGGDDDAAIALLEKLSALCAAHPGQVPARLILQIPAGYKVIVQSGDGKRVLPSDALITSIERLKGVVSVTRT